MSTLKTHNLQSPDAGSVNIAMAPNSGMVVAGLSTYSNQINVGNNIKLGNAGVITATTFVGAFTGTASGNPTMSSGANDRVMTATGSNAMKGESALTFDGATLDIDGGTTDTPLILDTSNASGSHLRFRKDGSNKHFVGSGGGFGLGNVDDLSLRTVNNIIFGVGTSEKVRIDTNGRLSFAGDTDTYIHHPQANQLAITIAGGSFPTVRFGTGGSGSTVGFSTDTTLVTNAERISVRGFSSFKSYSNVYAAIYTHNEGNTSGTYNPHLLWNAGGANRGGIGYMPNNGELIFNNQNAINFATGATTLGGTTKLRITNGGQIGIGQDTNGNINTRAVLEIGCPFDDVSDNDGSADMGTNNHDAILLNIAGPAAASGKNIGCISWDKGGRRRAAIMGEYQSTDNDYLALAFFTRGTDGSGDFYKSFIINHNGSAGLHGSLSQNTSDDRLKKDKVEIENALDKVNSLSSFTHKWNEIAVRAGLEENKTEIGLSAQEVQGLYPSLVNVNNTMIDPDNPTTEYLTIHYEKVVPLLVASIKELTSEINSLKSRLSSLEGS